MQIEDHVAGPCRLAEELRRDECAAEEAGLPELARLYVVPLGLALGPRDARLPHAAKASAILAARGVDVAVRSSGGQAVGLTAGVLNVALSWSRPPLPSLEEAFARLTDLLRQALAAYGVRVQQGLVEGSFCPGSTDLAVAGRKLAGLSQRRRRTSVTAHAFLWVAGPPPLHLVAEFYRLAGGDGAPRLASQAMTSLTEASGRPLKPADVAATLVALLQDTP